MGPSVAARATLVAALVLASPSAFAQAEARKISFTEAVQTALADSPEVRIADQAIAAASHRVKGVRAQRLPKLRAEGNLLWWNDEISFFLPPPAMGEPPIEAVVRERLTWQATAQVVQPLSPLIVLSTLIDLEEAGVDAAKADRDRARLDAAARAAEAYLRALQARAGAEIAQRTLTQVEANLDRVRKLREAGVAGDLDVLRLEAARDQVRQGALRARAGEETALRALALTLSLPDGTMLAVVDDFPETPPGPDFSAEEVVAAALKRRPELKAAADRARQADKGRRAAYATMLPNILAVAQVQHTAGQGTFGAEDSWFVGVTLQWDLWDWGKNQSGVDEAAARQRQAEIAREALAEQVAFDARRRVLEAETAYETLAVARSGLAAAEEAYRLQTVRNEEGVATTTEVLDAETEVASARTAFALARYDYLISLVTLARAMGDAPAGAVKP